MTKIIALNSLANINPEEPQKNPNINLNSKKKTIDVLSLLDKFNHIIETNEWSLNKKIYQEYQMDFQNEDKYSKKDLMDIFFTEMIQWDGTRMNYCYWLYLELKRRVQEKKPVFKIIK